MHFTNNEVLAGGNCPKPSKKWLIWRSFSSLAWKPAWVFSNPSAAQPSLPAATPHGAATDIAGAFRFSICSWRIHVITEWVWRNQNSLRFLADENLKMIGSHPIWLVQVKSLYPNLSEHKRNDFKFHFRIFIWGERPLKAAKVFQNRSEPLLSKAHCVGVIRGKTYIWPIGVISICRPGNRSRINANSEEIIKRISVRVGGCEISFVQHVSDLERIIKWFFTIRTDSDTNREMNHCPR